MLRYVNILKMLNIWTFVNKGLPMISIKFWFPIGTYNDVCVWEGRGGEGRGGNSETWSLLFLTCLYFNTTFLSVTRVLLMFNYCVIDIYIYIYSCEKMIRLTSRDIQNTWWSYLNEI